MIKELVKGCLPYALVKKLQSSRQKAKMLEKDRLKKHRINEVLKSNEAIYLELGSGPKKGSNNWITMDLSKGCDLPCNLLEGIPLPDNSVSKIYSSHFLEHFHTLDILKILTECYRVLKPEGWISASVPDGSIYVMAYANKERMDPEIWLRYKPAAKILSGIDYINYMAYLNDEHKHLFDIDNLCAIFREVGFRNARQRTLIKGLDLDARDYQSIYVEAFK